MAYFVDEFSLTSGSIDLSKATELKDVALKWEFDMHPRWVAATLQTITHSHRNLQQILLKAQVLWNHFGQSVDLTRDEIGGTLYRGWLKLDEVLSQLLESHSIYSEVVCILPRDADESQAGYKLGNLLPKATMGGMIDLIAQHDRW